MNRFPDSDYVPIVRQFKTEVEENLAAGDLGVGQFYQNKGNYPGALGRYEEITKEYKDFSAMDQVYFLIGNIFQKSLENLQQAAKIHKTSDEKIKAATNKAIREAGDQAADYYSRIVVGYPFSEYFEEAKARLKAMGRSVPDVDTQLAASHQARLKPDEGFSPLRPIIDFGKALGFVGLPDRYDEAQKILAEGKVKGPEGAKTGEGSPAGDIQIETIIRKSASGKTEDVTTLGGKPVPASQSDQDKDKDKDKDKEKE